MSDELTLSDVMARLDKQAKAIKDLRARVSTLEGCDQSQPAAPKPYPQQGEYVHSPQCAMCGEFKGQRRTLTCRECGARRTRIIKGLEERISYDECVNCGVPKGGGMKMLCDPCSASFKQWKAGS